MTSLWYHLHHPSLLSDVTKALSGHNTHYTTAFIWLCGDGTQAEATSMCDSTELLSRQETVKCGSTVWFMNRNLSCPRRAWTQLQPFCFFTLPLSVAIGAVLITLTNKWVYSCVNLSAAYPESKVHFSVHIHIHLWPQVHFHWASLSLQCSYFSASPTCPSPLGNFPEFPSVSQRLHLFLLSTLSVLCPPVTWACWKRAGHKASLCEVCV